jgi:rod shape-determining protein MreC
MATYRRARSTRLLVIALVLASLMTITLDFRAGERGPLAVLGRGALTVITPLQEAVAGISRPVGAFFSTLANLGNLRRENSDLRAEVARARQEQATLVSLKRELQELQGLLDIKERFDLPTRGANVIAESPSNFEWAVEIDRGSSDGVSLDMPVIAADGLVGRVVKVSPSSSVVMLITDPDSRVGVKLASSGERGLLLGGRGEELRLDLINPDTEIQPAEPVLTSGYQGSLFPPGIPIGEVARAESSDVELTRPVFVRPYVDFSRLDHVLLILPHPDVGELGR